MSDTNNKTNPDVLSVTGSDPDTGDESDTGNDTTTKPKSNTLSIVSTIAIWGFILALLIMVILMLVFGYQKDLPKRMFPETDVEGDLIVQGKLARYNDNVVEVDRGTASFTLTQEDSGKIYYKNDTTTRTITLPSNCKSGTNYRIITISPGSNNSNTKIVTGDTANFYGHALVAYALTTGNGDTKMYSAGGDTEFSPNVSPTWNTTSKIIKTGTNWSVSAVITSSVTPQNPFESS